MPTMHMSHSFYGRVYACMCVSECVLLCVYMCIYVCISIICICIVFVDLSLISLVVFAGNVYSVEIRYFYLPDHSPQSMCLECQ